MNKQFRVSREYMICRFIKKYKLCREFFLRTYCIYQYYKIDTLNLHLLAIWSSLIITYYKYGTCKWKIKGKVKKVAKVLKIV